MPATTKTIDQRIRERANQETERRIRNIFEPAFSLCRIGNSLDTGIPNKSASDCLEAARLALVEYHKKRDEEQAVEDFLKQVDRLGHEVEELRNGINDHG